MAQHAISAVHYKDGKIDLVAIHPVVHKELGSSGLALGSAQRISLDECLQLLAAGEEICLVRRTEDHTWEITWDVELGPSGKEITSVDLTDRPNTALQDLPRWE
jgi:hypothetical protein